MFGQVLGDGDFVGFVLGVFEVLVFVGFEGGQVILQVLVVYCWVGDVDVFVVYGYWGVFVDMDQYVYVFVFMWCFDFDYWVVVVEWFQCLVGLLFGL